MIQITTWNICTQKYFTSKTITTPENRIELILKRIQKNDSDILCLQEVDLDNPLFNFIFLLSDNYDGISHQITKKRTNTFGNITLWKKNKFILTQQKLTSSSVVVLLQEKLNNTYLFIGNVHLRAGFNSNVNERINQLKSVFKIWNDFNIQKGIITGDFNDEYFDIHEKIKDYPPIISNMHRKIEHNMDLSLFIDNSDFKYKKQSPPSFFNTEESQRKYSYFDFFIVTENIDFEYEIKEDDKIIEESDHIPIHVTVF